MMAWLSRKPNLIDSPDSRIDPWTSVVPEEYHHHNHVDLFFAMSVPEMDPSKRLGDLSLSENEHPRPR
jgi:hypothetical protein